MQNGPMQNFAKIFRQERKFLVTFLLKKGLPMEECEDLVQEAYMKYLTQGSLCEGIEQRRLLTTITRNLYIDRCRRAKRTPMIHDQGILDAVAEDQSTHRKLAQRVMMEHMVESVDDQREGRYFKLYYQTGVTIQEIARMANAPQGTVATQINRFRHRMSKTWTSQLDLIDNILA